MDSFRAPFSASEYARRLETARAAMATAGLDALVVTDPSNIAWLTGYDGWSFYTHQAVILDHAEDPVWWGRMQDTNGARRIVWMGRTGSSAMPTISCNPPPVTRCRNWPATSRKGGFCFNNAELVFENDSSGAMPCTDFAQRLKPDMAIRSPHASIIAGEYLPCENP